MTLTKQENNLDGGKNFSSANVTHSSAVHKIVLPMHATDQQEKNSFCLIKNKRNASNMAPVGIPTTIKQVELQVLQN